MIIPRQDLFEDIKNINDELDKWNKNPWLPSIYIKALIASHLDMYEKLESITCLCVEAVELMTHVELAEAILNQIEKT